MPSVRNSQEEITAKKEKRKKINQIHRPFKVIAAGCHRSGSTWLFNALRLILANKGDVYSSFIKQYDHENPAAIHLIKTHRFNKTLAAALNSSVFTTCRDLRDIAASAMRRNLIQEEEAVAYIERLLCQEYHTWKKYSKLEIRYEDLIENKPKHISMLASILNITVNAKKIHKKIELLEVPQKEIDPVTLLNPGHITDGKAGNFMSTMSETTSCQIQQQFYEWQVGHGYKD